MSTPIPAGLDQLVGLPFVKMTGSGNDFVVFDGRQVPLDVAVHPQLIAAICHRTNGIGADGVVLLHPGEPSGVVRLRYFNRDGTEGELCGNATLCSTALAVRWGVGAADGMVLVTGDGPVQARQVHGQPQIRLAPAREVRETVPGVAAEQGTRVGFAVVGVPHLVLTSANVEAVDVDGLGPGLRRHPALGAPGANVNWVQPLPDGRWRYRTFERGVEGETLACGTGAVAVATLLRAWGLLDLPLGAGGGAASEMPTPTSVTLVTSSGKPLTVTLPTASEAASGVGAALAGEGRVVFTGTVASLG